MKSLLLCGLVAVNAVNAAAAELRDKTLVVWAAPANLTQHGGSALTLDDGQAHFDGIVFGELATRRWMPGSDFHRRTHRPQDAWPRDTAGGQTTIQIAITYRERDITIFRNGERYAQYAMPGSPQEFDRGAVVLLGMRHLDQADQAHFAGTIDDARIYDRALTQEEIAQLKPNANEPSNPKPWAWWTFDEPTPRDRIGRFVSTQLAGGAKVENGKLVLDGQDGVMFASRTAGRLAAVPRGDLETARRLRHHLLADKHRPTYHFVIPEDYAMPFDPNGAIFWQGRYHLFCIY